MENIILVDYDPPQDWEFHKAIEESTGEKWQVKCAVSNQHGGMLKKIIRYFKYFTVPFQIFVNIKDYKSVLAWQQFYGLILAFYCRVFCVRNAPEITIMTFIYNPKRGIVGKLYQSFMHYVVHSGYVKQFIVFSESEKYHYAKVFDVSETLFTAEKLGIDDEQYKTEKQEFYIAAGRSNRDYEFLRRAWPSGLKLEIICDTGREKDTEDIAYLKNCNGEEFLKHLAVCKAVVIPLNDKNVSSGQLVILQSMMFGKPVIVTENDTIHDYIENGNSGLIIEKTEKELKAALTKLENPEFYDRISINARTRYEEKYTVRKMGLRIGEKL